MVNVNRYGGVCNVKNPDKRVYNLWYGMLRRYYRRGVKCKGYKIAKMDKEGV